MKDAKLYLDKDIKLKWQQVNETFACTFREDLKDREVYMHIHKSGLYLIACRYPSFPRADMIHWIISHTDSKTMTLSSVSGMKFETLWERNYDEMYKMVELVTIMSPPFILPNNRVNSRDILKDWVKELARFRMKPNQIYKTNILRKVY